MSNMSYCRFQNTLGDLRDCEEHFSDNDLSEDERKARNQMLKLCKDIGENYNPISEKEESEEDEEE